MKLIRALAEVLIAQSARVTESGRRAESDDGDGEGAKGWMVVDESDGVREAEIARRPPEST